MDAPKRPRNARQSPGASSAIPIRFRSGSISGKGYMQNVSEAGMYLQIDHPPPLHADATVALDTPDGRKLEVHGRVIWTTAERAAANGNGNGNGGAPGFGVVLEASGPDFHQFVAALEKD
jgi:Tfp pilus assembly protein PilZ